MPDLLFDRQRGALDELWRLIEERRQGEAELTFSSAQAEETAVEKGERARKHLANKQEGELAALDAAFHQEQKDLTNRQAIEEVAAQRALIESRQRLETAERAERDRIGEEMRDALWMAESVLEGGQKRAQEQLEVVRHQLAGVEERIATLWQSVELLLARFDLVREDVTPSGKLAKPPAKTSPDPEGPLSR